jgi:hypothetical protein
MDRKVSGDAARRNGAVRDPDVGNAHPGYFFEKLGDEKTDPAQGLQGEGSQVDGDAQGRAHGAKLRDAARKVNPPRSAHPPP